MRFRKPPKNPQINWADDLLTRWHRDALYFVVVMRTPHGHPPTFETHAARWSMLGAADSGGGVRVIRSAASPAGTGRCG
jgi:hypothetical protein